MTLVLNIFILLNLYFYVNILIHNLLYKLYLYNNLLLSIARFILYKNYY